MENRTKGVATLLGDPKKALIKLSVPMIIAMSIQTVYNIVDTIWVAGIGTDALSAVGFFFPFYMVLVALSIGLGIGGGSVISRLIGAGDKESANSAAVHTLLMMLAGSLLYMVPALLVSRQLFLLTGAGSALERALSYGRPMFSGTLIFFFIQVGSALLRSEGDVNKVMIANITGGVLNLILDPFFIYRFKVTLPLLGETQLGLGLDVAGAAYATLISVGVSCVLVFYWLFIQKKTYLRLHLKGFKIRTKIIGSILGLGVPSAFSQLSMALMMMAINRILTGFGGDRSVAVFTTGWRVVMIAILPLLGMGSAVTAIGGAAFGARQPEKLRTLHLYSVRLGILIEIGVAVLTYVFAPYIARAFTWSPETIQLRGPITGMLRFMCFFYPATASGILTSALFQGTGRGLTALFITIARTFIFTVPLALLFGRVLGLAVNGVYLGMITSNWMASMLSFFWMLIFIRSYRKKINALTPETVLL